MPRPQLLISVRNAAEAADALTAGADLIDVKEPNHGALGMADPETIYSVLAVVKERVPTSIALGELREANRMADAEFRPTFAKFGLSGAAGLADWRTQLKRAIAELPTNVQPVAVAYADWREAAAPAPHDVLEAATQLGCRGLLLDTYGKSGGSLVHRMDGAELSQLLSRARQSGLLTVLAGGLQLDALEALAPLSPDYFGFRGAVCRDGRESILDPRLVSKVRQALQELGRFTVSPAAHDDSACSGHFA